MSTLNEAPSPALVDADWLRDHLDDPDVRLVEVDRSGTEPYEDHHIPGAIGWNWKQALWDPYMREFPAPEDFARRMSEAGITPQTRVVIYGEPVQFGVYAWFVMRYCGHENTVMLDGGHRNWVAAGHEMTTARPAARRATDYPVQARQEWMRASRDDVLEAIDRDDTLILDVRSPDEYHGRALGGPKSNHGAERYGHIPGARHLFFGELLDERERFRAPDDLRRLLEGVGATPDRKLIVYCRLSHRSTLAFFTMTQILGYPDVRVYDGSWTEWGSMVGMPIENPGA